MKAKLVLYRGLGLFFTGLGIVGIFLPLLPTTPFLLLALWFFSRSSLRLKEWLLTNRLCGKFLNDYYSGRGIPLRVKCYIIIVLWATILASAIWCVDILAVRLLLLAVAVGVTIHVARFKTKQMYKNIKILVPSALELAAFPKRLPYGVEIVESGVGMAEVAATLVKELADKPDLVVLAGIAGAYPDGTMSVGESCVVSSERVADLGAMRGEGFEPLYTKEYHSPVAERVESVRALPSCTVSCGSAPFIDYRGELSSEPLQRCELENMEGASFFALCLAAEVDFVEVRTVSNYTNDSRKEWKIEEALENLPKAVFGVIDELRGV